METMYLDKSAAAANVRDGCDPTSVGWYWRPADDGPDPADWIGPFRSKEKAEADANAPPTLDSITPEMIVTKLYPLAGHLMLEGKTNSDRRALAEAERYLDAIRSLARGE